MSVDIKTKFLAVPNVDALSKISFTDKSIIFILGTGLIYTHGKYFPNTDTINTLDIATKTWVGNNYLPLSGGTLTGRLGLTNTDIYLDYKGVRSWTILPNSDGNLVINSGDGSGNIYVRNSYLNLDSNNYSSYALPLHGTADTSNLLNNNGTLQYGASGLQYFYDLNLNTSNSPSVNSAPDANWWHIIRMNHNNSGGYYADLAFALNNTQDAPYFRIVVNGSVARGWSKFITSDNIGLQAVNAANTLTTARTIWGQSFDGSGNVDGTLSTRNYAVGNYTEGIRIHKASNGWSTLMFCGDDNTGDSGTSANSWSFHNDTNNNFILGHNSSSGNVFLVDTSNNITFGGNTTINGSITTLPNQKEWIFSPADGWYGSMAYDSGGNECLGIMFMNAATKFKIKAGYDSRSFTGGGAYTNMTNADLEIGSGYGAISGNTIMHAGNYNSYAPKLDGTGATGNWNISSAHLLIDGVTCSNWKWSGLGGQPSWLWGSNDGVNMYVWNPSNFNVNYANSAGSASFPYGFGGRNDSAPWGSSTLQSYTFITEWDYNSADIQFRNNGGQLNVGIDGFYWQNEGQYMCLDTNNFSSYAPKLDGTGASGNWNISSAHLLIDGVTCSNWKWSGLGGQPSWLWGSNDGVNMYVWNPSNFNVNYANSAGSASFPYGFDGRDGSAPWGSSTLQSYTFITEWDYNSADIQFRNNGGQLNVGIDGFYWQNEGQYMCLDTNNFSSYAPKLDGTGASGNWNINALHLLINLATWASNWSWIDQSGSPTWLWGTNDGANMYVWKPSNLSVNYATTSGSTNSLSGYSVVTAGTTSNIYNHIPAIGNDGVMEIGRYLDFHVNTSDGLDYSTRLTCVSAYNNNVCLPDVSGTLALKGRPTLYPIFITSNIYSGGTLGSSDGFKYADGTNCFPGAIYINVSQTFTINIPYGLYDGLVFYIKKCGSGNIIMGGNFIIDNMNYTSSLTIENHNLLMCVYVNSYSRWIVDWVS